MQGFVRGQSFAFEGMLILHSVLPNANIPVGVHVDLQLEDSGRKSFFFTVEKKGQIGLYAQHTAEEFDMQLLNAEGFIN